MTHSTHTPLKPEAAHRSIVSYSIGFLISLLLTLTSFYLAPALGSFAAPAIAVAAVTQLFVQLAFFLHLGSSKGPQTDLSILAVTGIIICILMGGTLWIMSNLEGLHTPPETIDTLYEEGEVAPQHELK